MDNGDFYCSFLFNKPNSVPLRATIISLGCALLHNSMRWFQLAPDGVYHVCTSQYSERCSRRGRLHVIATPPHFSPLVLHFCNTLIVSVVLSVRRFYSTTCAAYYFPRMPGRYPASRSLFKIIVSEEPVAKCAF